MKIIDKYLALAVTTALPMKANNVLVAQDYHVEIFHWTNTSQVWYIKHRNQHIAGDFRDDSLNNHLIGAKLVCLTKHLASTKKQT